MILNVVLFQLGWFACVLGAASGYAREGAIAAALLVALHIARAARPKREAMLAAAAAVLGFLFESALVQAGWVRFEAGVLVEGAAPYWMVALWALFATTLNESMRMLQTRPWIAAAFGAVGGPLAYYAGARMGALDLVQPAAMLAALAVGWALATPLLLSLARRLNVP
jgi:hypothetical protein